MPGPDPDGDFSHLDLFWKSSTAKCKQSRKPLEYIKDNFLAQVRESSTRGEALLDLLFTSTEDLTGEVRSGGSLDRSDYAVVEFSVLRGTGWAKVEAQP